MDDPAIRSAQIKPYRLAFSSVAAARYGPFRHGRLVGLTSASGVTGWGDAAPLPGFSMDTVEDIDQSWPLVTKHLNRLGGDGNDGDDGGDVFDRLPPALVFALEQALFSIEAQTHNRHPASLISSEYRRRIGINGLIDCAPEEAGKMSRALIQAGCSCIKLKVGHWPAPAGPAVISEIRRSIGPGVELRLDANRAWSLDKAVQFLDGLAESDIAYIEEPLADSADLASLASQTSVALALDESLATIEPGGLSEWSFAGCVVVKPTILGGIRRSLEFAREASTMGMTAVVSSAFESGLATLWLVALGASPLFDETAGLDTGRHLESDILSPRLQLGFNPEVAVTARALEPLDRDEFR
ncbi:MAG: o-succinylbenzoate synthase [Rhodothermia bacterium]